MNNGAPYRSGLRGAPRRAASYVFIAVIVLTAVSCATNGGTSSNGNLGETGKACNITLCTAKWCTDDHQGNCQSNDCVGQANKTYCTIGCDFSGECPNGYSCTDNCTGPVFTYPVCVSNGDYTYLQSIGYCPK